MKICLLTILFMTLSVALAAYGVNPNNGAHLTPQQYQCFKKTGYNVTYINTFVTDKQGNINPGMTQQLNLARSAGFIADIVIILNRNNNATAQVNAVMTNIPTSLFRTIWIQVTTWQGFSAESNCAYLQELINSAKIKGKSPGIFTNSTIWKLNFVNNTGCPAAASQPLWYDSSSGDTCNNTADFKPFGGWTKPNRKFCYDWGFTCLAFFNFDFDFQQ